MSQRPRVKEDAQGYARAFNYVSLELRRVSARCQVSSFAGKGVASHVSVTCERYILDDPPARFNSERERRVLIKSHP